MACCFPGLAGVSVPSSCMRVTDCTRSKGLSYSKAPSRSLAPTLHASPAYHLPSNTQVNQALIDTVMDGEFNAYIADPATKQKTRELGEEVKRFILDDSEKEAKIDGYIVVGYSEQ